MKDEEIKKKVEDFNKKLKETALGVNEMKPEAKKRFLEISKDDFGNHHGVAIEWLCKLYDGYFPKGTEEVEAKIDLLADEIEKIKGEINSLKKEPEEQGDFNLSADGSRKIRKS